MSSDQEKRKPSNNFIGEWYGVRLYPDSYCKTENIENFKEKTCPYLSEILRHKHKCIKNEKSQGVCTITTRDKDKTKDWMVCPYRALDHNMLLSVVELIFGDNGSKKVVPVLALSDGLILEELKTSNAPFYLFFQDKLGGEISIFGTPFSPELSFDITIIKAEFKDSQLIIEGFGIYEIQTMDFHGSYGEAVKALQGAVDLHEQEFHEIIKEKKEWLSRKIEGPNIANVFKRTVYQTVLKFKLAGKSDCSGAVLGIPSSVWNSWKPHLGELKLKHLPNDTYCLEGSEDCSSKTWIVVFDLVPNPEKGLSEIKVKLKIRIEPNDLLKAAFENVPSTMVLESLPRMRAQIIDRIKKYCKNVIIQ